MDDNTKNKHENEFSLLDIFNLWYRLKFYPTNETKKSNLRLIDLSINHIQEIWQEVWFAKNEKQKIIDKELLIFEFLIEKYKDYKPQELYEIMAMIILYDQITRNIFRKSKKAYEFDNISRNLSLNLFEKIDKFPFQFRLTILICLCHSEDLEHQTKIREYLNSLLDSNIYQKYQVIINTLIKISDNHYIRVSKFGRIPERNHFVGRINTDEEQNFLDNLK